MLLLLIPGFGLIAQTGENNANYHVGIGLRAGETSGITLNVNTSGTAGLEFIAGLWSNWITFTALYEKRADAFQVNGLRWYYGAGGHIAGSTGTYYSEGRLYTRGQDYGLGADGTVGLEYKIPQIPFALNAGIKPFFEIYRNGDLFLGMDPGIGIKFTF